MSGSTLKLPDNLEDQSQRLAVNQPVNRDREATTKADIDPASVHHLARRLWLHQFNRHKACHGAAQQLLTPSVELTRPDPMPTGNRCHYDAGLGRLLQDCQLLVVTPIPATLHPYDRSAIPASAHTRLV